MRFLSLLLCLLTAPAFAAPPKKAPARPPAEAAPQDIDVDAMARAKDVDAKAAAAPGSSAAGSPATAPAGEAAPQDAAPAEAAPDAPAPAASGEEAADAPALAKPAVDPQEKRLAGSCEARAKSLLDSAQKGDFKTASKDFDAKMRGAMPPDKFKQTWDSLAQFGVLQARGQSHPGKGEGYYIVMTPLIFEKTTLVAQVACGNDGLIAGFYVKPLSVVQ